MKRTMRSIHGDMSETNVPVFGVLYNLEPISDRACSESKSVYTHFCPTLEAESWSQKVLVPRHVLNRHLVSRVWHLQLGLSSKQPGARLRT